MLFRSQLNLKVSWDVAIFSADCSRPLLWPNYLLVQLPFINEFIGVLLFLYYLSSINESVETTGTTVERMYMTKILTELFAKSVKYRYRHFTEKHCEKSWEDAGSV